MRGWRRTGRIERRVEGRGCGRAWFGSFGCCDGTVYWESDLLFVVVVIVYVGEKLYLSWDDFERYYKVPTCKISTLSAFKPRVHPS